MATQTFTMNDRVLVYWEISSIYRGRLDKPLNAELAFRRMNRVFEITNPNSLISNRLHKLREELIRGPEHENVVNSAANA